MKHLLYANMRTYSLLLALIICSLELPAQFYQSFTSAGTEMYYRTYGEGEPVILLAGGPGIGAEQIVDIAEKIGQSQQAILLDQRGTGKSALSAINANSLNLNLLIEDIENLRKTLKIKKMTLMGHSWGAMYAMLYAKSYPKRVKKMILVSTGGVDMTFYGRYRQNLMEKYTTQELTRLKYLNQLRRAGRADAKLDREFRTLEFKARVFDGSQIQAYSDILIKGKINDQVLHLLLSQIQEEYDVKGAFEGFEAEVLIIQGKECPLGEDTAVEVLANFPNGRIQWIFECGHFPWIEQPDAFYKALKEALN